MASSTTLLLGEVTDVAHLRSVRVALSAELLGLGLADDRVDDAVVMLSELAANALEHAHPPVSVSLSWTDDEVVVSVFDRNDELPVPRASDPVRAGGRGMMIVAAFADRHGVERGAQGGKSVWFALDRHRSG